MDAIEAADGDRGAQVAGLQPLQSTHVFHHAPAALRKWCIRVPDRNSTAKYMPAPATMQVASRAPRANGESSSQLAGLPPSQMSSAAMAAFASSTRISNAPHPGPALYTPCRARPRHKSVLLTAADRQVEVAMRICGYAKPSFTAGRATPTFSAMFTPRAIRPTRTGVR